MAQLWQTHSGLCRKLARRYRWMLEADPALEYDDLVQTAFLGLVKARESFDPTAGKRFSGWAAWFIARELRRLLGWQNASQPPAHCFAVRLDAPIDAADPSGDTLLDAVADESNPDTDANLLREEIVKAVREAVEALPDARQRQTVLWVGLEGKTLREAAEALNVPVSTVPGLEHRAKQRLARNPRLRALADLDEQTRFCAYKGVAAFERDWTSTTEAAALWRIEQRADSGETK